MAKLALLLPLLTAINGVDADAEVVSSAAPSANTALEGFSPQLVRENLKSSWDSSSIQRLDCRLPPSVDITSAVPIDGHGRRFMVNFSDGNKPGLMSVGRVGIICFIT
jgi:hypothetical protein